VGYNGVDGARPNANSAASLFEPVRSGLQQVEGKLRTMDSSLFSPLANAFVNLIDSGGKRLRPALALLAAEFNGSALGQAASARVISLAASVEMLHTSTLVHDDVIDGALLRRGAPTLNAIWTGGSTILAGNFMFGAAATLAAETENMRVIRIFSQTLKIIVDGELQQLLARYDYDQPKDSYYQRIYAKTASLFCAATEGAAILSGLSEARVQDLHDYGYNLGMAFQIVDDILDFTGDEGTLGKPAGSDLHQGTLTLPFFYYRRNHQDPARLIERLERARVEGENGNPALWRHAVDALVHDLRASHAVQSAREEAEHFLARARASLEALPDNVYKRALMNLCDFVVQREY
jgi:geranylgeranyl pyrophosphate synthase